MQPTICPNVKILTSADNLLSECLRQLMGLAKCLGGFHNIPSMLQTLFPPQACGALNE